MAGEVGGERSAPHFAVPCNCAGGHVYLSLVIIFIGRQKNYRHPSIYMRNDVCYNFIKKYWEERGVDGLGDGR